MVIPNLLNEKEKLLGTQIYSDHHNKQHRSEQHRWQSKVCYYHLLAYLPRLVLGFKSIVGGPRATHLHVMDPCIKLTWFKASKKLAFNPYLETSRISTRKNYGQTGVTIGIEWGIQPFFQMCVLLNFYSSVKYGIGISRRSPKGSVILGFYA